MADLVDDEPQEIVVDCQRAAPTAARSTAAAAGAFSLSAADAVRQDADTAELSWKMVMSQLDQHLAAPASTSAAAETGGSRTSSSSSDGGHKDDDEDGEAQAEAEHLDSDSTAAVAAAAAAAE